MQISFIFFFYSLWFLMKNWIFYVRKKRKKEIKVNIIILMFSQTTLRNINKINLNSAQSNSSSKQDQQSTVVYPLDRPLKLRINGYNLRCELQLIRNFHALLRDGDCFRCASKRENIVTQPNFPTKFPFP